MINKPTSDTKTASGKPKTEEHKVKPAEKGAAGAPSKPGTSSKS